MNNKLEEAIALIQSSMSQMESLQKELSDTRTALDKKSQLLDLEVAKNIRLNEEVEKLNAKVAQLTKSEKAEPERAPKPNRVSEVMARRAKAAAEVTPSFQKTEVAEQDSSDRFSLIDIPFAYRPVISKTQHLHRFLRSKIDAKTPKLQLWLNQSEVEKYYKAKQVLLNIEPQTIESSRPETTITAAASISSGTSSYVTKDTLLRDVELPHFLVDIGKLTLEAFGPNLLISQVLDIDDIARRKFSVPVAVTLPGLKSHLKKRIKQRSALKLEIPGSTSSENDAVTSLSDTEAQTVTSSKNVSNNSPLHDPILGATSQYTTQKGRVLDGWYIDLLPEEKVRKIDPYTFKVEGRYFVRERYKDALLAAIRSFTGGANHSVQVTQEDGDSILSLLGEEFVFVKNEMNSVTVLFEFDAHVPNKILINTAHPYLQQVSTLSHDFWNSIYTFMVLWLLLKKMNLQNEAIEQIALARTQIMRALTSFTDKQVAPIYKVKSLPSNVLFDVSSFASGMVIHVNESHPFNEHYLVPLKEHEKETFIKIYAAWLHAEKQTLSNSTELALQTTRKLIGTEFYHLVDEVKHGNELF
ncbi:hypothetical protein EDB67_10476 [Vibrio crassostreae]|uniref:hypothetical protein n=1 Tax=Vibrio crassostreae TaxID=246167 RepID=UPI000F468064|nr:hypothetical protein [Vibrio crassostreae]ROR25426.1 hypothetical protein EDB67_10476 [Vibrio crassostreae]